MIDFITLYFGRQYISGGRFNAAEKQLLCHHPPLPAAQLLKNSGIYVLVNYQVF